MSIESQLLAEQNVPRYTSYPTAPHFSAAVGPDIYAAWLAELPPAEALSLITGTLIIFVTRLLRMRAK